MHRPLIRRDSKPWQLQVWASFGIAVALCAIGLAYLPGQDLDRAFMFMGYLFCLSAAFVLAKFVRDGEAAQAGLGARTADTPMFRLVVWGSFALAMALTGWGLLRMDIHSTYKVFLGVSWLYLITCAFTLAKMLRDRQEADLLEAEWRGRRDAHRSDPARREPEADTP
ncbi:MAG: YiaA/YiaB family inner membrane protein [Pseudomonadota bacterium]|nr:YiaA/YiaB family inner membrane protein [Pseudomonadota bacterium]